MHFPCDKSINQHIISRFFGDHGAVIGVFLASGFTLAGLVLLLFCCLRRRRRQIRSRGTRLPEISHPQPMQNPFADVTENPTVREQVGSNARWHGFMLPRHRASSTQSSGSVSFTHNRSKDSLPAEYGAPAPPPPAQRPSSRASRSSHRVPVPYAGVGAHGDDMRQVESWQTTGGPSEHLLTQIVQNDPPPPPRLPPRSPLRSLATNDVAKALQESALNLSLSRASTPSIYPPSIHHPDADVDADPIYQKEIVATLPSSSDK